MLESFSVQHRVWLAVAVVAASCTWLLMRRRKWVPVGKLTNIYIYPLKSGHWQELPEAECTTIGPRYSPNSDKVALRDRVFLAYDKEKMEFISGKLCPKMIYIDVVPKTSKTVVFSHPDMKDIEVTLPEHFDDDIITMWAHEKIRTVDCGDAIAKWMSELIRGQPEGVRVGYWPETEKWRRNIEALRAKEIEIFKNMSNKHTGAYSDLSSYHLVSKDSVADLNKRLEDTKKVEPLNFRPNLVIEGAAPYDEDKWDWIKIGEVVFRRFRPCTRCNFTTVNPETAQKSPFNEPIKTLKTYRTMKQLGEERVDPHYPVMGQYIGVVEPGVIRAGDTVFISS